ncbi:MAG: EscU/YscU/HrcU family type III secretion system export apparatus switch protein [Zetaproteobacteria bacterium]|nr:EscU/YscU/HrcU family type III secretion system export apparatus switch protein [Zetaproteobacteria bacterium]
MKDQPAAVALGYDPKAPKAPKVLASGLGEIAKKILEIARENDVHIHKDDNLAQLLAQVPVGSEIPEEAYQLVAELLSFLYQTDQKMAEKMTTK